MRSLDQTFLRNVLKFSHRVKQMPVSKLTSLFHSFGAAGVTNTRITATSIVKRVKRGKIYVQPEAVKRRKIECGSKSKRSKGQLKKNPFELKAGKGKRTHTFAQNVRNNETVAKKAGRTMGTRTRCYEKNTPNKKEKK